MRAPRVAEILSVIKDGGDEQVMLPARLCAECLSALPVSGVGVALMTAAGPSGVVLAALEELRFTLGEAPCVEASDSGRPVLVPDLSAAGSTRRPRGARVDSRQGRHRRLPGARARRMSDTSRRSGPDRAPAGGRADGGTGTGALQPHPG